MLSKKGIAYVKGVGTMRADILRKELGVETILDMLRQYPYKYIDRSKFYQIRDIADTDTYVQIIGEIIEWHTVGTGKTARLSATFSDGFNAIELVWFKGIQYVKLEKGIKYLLFGKPSAFNHAYNFVHPELTPMSKVNTDLSMGLEPHYNTTELMKRKGLTSKQIRTIMANLMPELEANPVQDTLGQDMLDQYHLLSLTQAFKSIHFPKNMREAAEARKRFKFEELFYIQLQILKQGRQRADNKGFVFPISGATFRGLYESLPFDLTNAQKRVIREIFADMKTGKQMNRLVQGDVGSGKTLVALFSCLLAVDNGFQACLMAPTEILANQHFLTLQSFLSKVPSVRVALLTGSTTKKQRAELLPALLRGDIDILVGTHALLEDEVQWGNLGLAVIDEQHRFGVAQRAKLWAKNICPPHVLVMTATPIPRTLAMTVYGDLHVSVIDELPPGRKPVHTMHYSIERKASIYQFIDRQIKEGRQVYVVFPLIQENEKLDMKDLQSGYNELCEVFPNYSLSMVHGKMKAKDKDEQMKRFAEGHTQILVATTVIEVGVNVPNASVMVIQNAERFGLSQLHQLRGRVGRGADQSYCLLLTKVELSKDTRQRMDIMVATNDGFRIAEADLQLRGPGDLEGTAQSGLPFELRIASLASDGQILELAREAAMRILDADPGLDEQINKIYRERLHLLHLTAQDWSEIS